MVVEIADFTITEGDEEKFLAAYRDVRELLTTTPGCRSARMTHGIETPTRFVLVVEWDSVAAHEENFRATDRFIGWRGALGPFFAAAPRVEHFSDV